MKLQKLVYYTRAWSLTLLNTEPFPEQLEAWEKWPAVKRLRAAGKFDDLLDSNKYECDMSLFNEVQVALFQEVRDNYGNLSAEKLSDMTHSEQPRQEAKNSGLRNKDISKETVKKYYKLQLKYAPKIDIAYLDEVSDIAEARKYVKAGKLKFS